MKPQPAPSNHHEDECVFCGDTNTTDVLTSVVALNSSTENQQVCDTCLKSLEGGQPMLWLRWLKRNDPAHWQRVVDYHRLGTSVLSDVIRRMRIE